MGLYDGWKKLRHGRSYLYLLSKGSTMKVFVVFMVLGSVSQFHAQETSMPNNGGSNGGSGTSGSGNGGSASGGSGNGGSASGGSGNGGSASDGSGYGGSASGGSGNGGSGSGSFGNGGYGNGGSGSGGSGSGFGNGGSGYNGYGSGFGNGGSGNGGYGNGGSDDNGSWDYEGGDYGSGDYGSGDYGSGNNGRNRCCKMKYVDTDDEYLSGFYALLGSEPYWKLPSFCISNCVYVKMEDLMEVQNSMNGMGDNDYEDPVPMDGDFNTTENFSGYGMESGGSGDGMESGYNMGSGYG